MGNLIFDLPINQRNLDSTETCDGPMRLIASNFWQYLLNHSMKFNEFFVTYHETYLDKSYQTFFSKKAESVSTLAI